MRFPAVLHSAFELARGSPLPSQEPEDEILDPGPCLDEMVPRYTRIFLQSIMSPDGAPSRDLPETILLAADNVGSDGEGTDGVIGYFSRIARLEPDRSAKLLEGFLAVYRALDHERVAALDLSPERMRALATPESIKKVVEALKKAVCG